MCTSVEHNTAFCDLACYMFRNPEAPQNIEPSNGDKTGLQNTCYSLTWMITREQLVDFYIDNFNARTVHLVQFTIQTNKRTTYTYIYIYISTILMIFVTLAKKKCKTP
jgi:hypothetical protein